MTKNITEIDNDIKIPSNRCVQSSHIWAWTACWQIPHRFQHCLSYGIPSYQQTSFQLLCWKVSCRHPLAHQGYCLADPSYHIAQQGPDYTLHHLPSTCLNVMKNHKPLNPIKFFSGPLDRTDCKFPHSSTILRAVVPISNASWENPI